MFGKKLLLILPVCAAVLAVFLWAGVGTVRTVQVPVLMYHSITSDAAAKDTQVSVETFSHHLAALREAGYTGVSVEELIDFVQHGKALPEKPVLITFDDGYLNNYELAYPILREYDTKATIFIVGCSVGHSTYKDTEFPMSPHFSYEQAAEMLASGLVDIQSHTYDMHQWPPYETGDRIREGVLPLEGESDEAFAAAITEDLERGQSEMEAATGRRFLALAYPYGRYNELAEATLLDLGIQVTLTTAPGGNTVSRGQPQTLRTMNRYTVTEALTGEALVELLEGE